MAETVWHSYADFTEFLARLGGEVTEMRYDLAVAEQVIPLLFPERFAPAVVIAGTNGKGSVAWWLAQVFQAAGYRTALYTSPHLLHLTERIRLDGTPADPAAVYRHACVVREVVHRLGGALPRRPTYFEWLTFVAASLFREARADVHVLEVGLGGRFDAVNVAAPMLSVITSVGLDHCQFLGDSITAIAREKMGVLRRSAPAVLGPQDGWADEVMDDLVAGCGALVPARPVYEAEFAGECDWRLGLDGAYQRYNAATVVTCCRVLRAFGWRLDEAAIRRGLACGGWPGRMERLVEAPSVVVDGAHNVAAVRELVREIDRFDPRPVVVFGAMRDKDLHGMLALLRPAAAALVLTRPPTPRAAGADDYAAWLDDPGVRFREEPGKALREAQELAGPDGHVVVAGSLYLVAEIKQRVAEEGAR
ncbi:MAG TPA: cyanophycin synthetase [Acidobacteriota bacterium]|nr:cyanophycin synthetase [Acidobacteriota bacterium]HQG92416.1 cyanophycin synthetase [Acidobacteriota bacterium]HQK87106.1 cyanophycin synthetase [Acidobacteriota bacterium]